MENKEQEVKQEQVPVTQYKYAHLVVHCGKCNSKYVMKKDVEGGIQINLPTASNSEVILVCKECKNTMAMYFVESDGSSLPKTETTVEDLGVLDNAVKHEDGSYTGTIDGEEIEVPAEALVETEEVN